MLQQKETNRKTAAGEGCRIFLVEDEEDDRLFSKRALE